MEVGHLHERGEMVGQGRTEKKKKRGGGGDFISEASTREVSERT